MTLVNADTGEMFDALTTEQAERLTTRISLKLDAMADTYVGVMPLIREAIERQAYIALGYRSVGEYVADRFGGSLGKLGVEMRREVVRELTDAGMSTRAIAPVVGISKDTVQRDYSAVSHETPQTPEPVVSGEAATGSGQTPESAGPTLRSPVTGIDGKTYARPALVRPQSLPRSPEQQNAEENSQHLAKALIFLLAFQHPNMRDHARIEWEVGQVALSPTQRGYVTPDSMRVAASGLTTLADEWEQS